MGHIPTYKLKSAVMLVSASTCCKSEHYF